VFPDRGHRVFLQESRKILSRLPTRNDYGEVLTTSRESTETPLSGLPPEEDQSSFFRLARRLSGKTKESIRSLQMSPLRWIFDIPVALLFGRNLKVLATLYGSDKWNTHWYAQHYQQILSPIRRKRLTVLEIGIGGYGEPRLGGGSLRMWRTWFPNAIIHGIDIEDKSPHGERRIHIHRGSQSDEKFLASVLEQSGTPDLIIDDGSHLNEHVISTFKFLFPRLADGGFYVVEDIQTSYWPDGHVTERNSLSTSMGFFKSLADGLNWEEYFGDYEPNDFDLSITGMFFFHNLVIIRKGVNREGSNNRTWHAHKPEWKATGTC
jgi:hypothetical protein